MSAMRFERARCAWVWQKQGCGCRFSPLGCDRRMLINSRPTIAWVTQKVACADEDQLWAGLEAGALEGDANLVCVRGRDLRSLEGWQAETIAARRMIEMGAVQAGVGRGVSLVR